MCVCACMRLCGYKFGFKIVSLCCIARTIGQNGQHKVLNILNLSVRANVVSERHFKTHLFVSEIL